MGQRGVWSKLPLLLLIGQFLYAKPSGFQLREGAATLTSKENCLLIQSGSSAIINWEDFSIDLKEKVQFDQLHSESYVLNCVTGPNPSALLGQLTSNGAIYLVNPNGIFIGSEAHIQTAGFIASTLDLLNEDLSEKTLHFTGDSEGGIVNQGKIECPIGDIFLIGRSVENSGILHTPEGRQGLLSGYDVIIRAEGSPQIRIRTEHIEQNILKDNPYAMAIRHSGESLGEEIYFIAEEGICEVSGKVTALKGGTVHVLGDFVDLLNGAEIDASGAYGGGEVLIGGDYQGKNPEVKNARYVWAETEVEVRANALEEGDGGRVIFWADQGMNYFATIYAEGGPQGGDGGLVEVSGKQLRFDGMVHALAPQGKAGTLLLDPTDITIIRFTPTTGTFSSCVGGNSNYMVNTAVSPNNIETGSLFSLLSSCNVTISTTSAGTDAGTITIGTVGTETYTSSNSLTLQADSSIIVNQVITNSGSGGISLTGSSILLNSGSLNTGGSLVINGPLTIPGGANITGSNITFSSTIIATGAPGEEVYITASNLVDFQGSIPGTPGFLFGIFSVTAPTINLPSACYTAAATFTGACVLTQDATFTAMNTFNGTLDGSKSLTIDSNGSSVLFQGVVGGTTPLRGIAISGPSQFNNNVTVSNGNITWTGSNITIGGNVTFTTLTSGDILVNGGGNSFLSTGGARSLTINAAGTFQFFAIGSITSPFLAGVTITANAISMVGVSPPGIWARIAPISLTANSMSIIAGATTATFQTNATGGIIGANITLNTPVTRSTTTVGTGGVNIIAGTAGTVTLQGAWSGSFLGNINISAASIRLQNSMTTRSGTLTFAGPVVLLNSPVLTTTGNSTAGADILFSSTINGTTSGSDALSIVSGTGTVHFSSTVGNSVPLGGLSVVSSGGITVGGNQTISSGALSYQGTVALASNVVFTNQGTGNTAFQGNITGNRNLSIIGTQTSSTLTIGANIDISGTADANGANLTITTAGPINITDSILTAGGPSSGVNGFIGGNVLITSSGGSITVPQIDTSGSHGTTGTGGNAGTITLQPASGIVSSAQGDLPAGFLILTDDLLATGGGGDTAGTGAAISLSATGRTQAPSVATITSRYNGNNVRIEGASLLIGPYEAITILGSLTINMSSSLTIGDVVALDALTIANAGASTTLLTHGSIQLLSSSGTFYTSPAVHFIARTSLTIPSNFSPSGPYESGVVSMTGSQFLSQLKYTPSQLILNYDTNITTTTTSSGAAAQEYALYQLMIADAELSDSLPIFSPALEDALPFKIYKKPKQPWKLWKK